MIIAIEEEEIKKKIKRRTERKIKIKKLVVYRVLVR